MSQETQVFLVEAGRGRALSDALGRAGYLFRTVPHALFCAQGEGVTATLYRSGKLVLQGSGLEAWASRFLGEPVPASPAPGRGAGMPQGLPAIGSDEAGKGDTFGGLAVCAVAATAEAAAALARLRVDDSKQMQDARVVATAARIRATLGPDLVEERVLDPADYNRRHAESGANVNRLLAALHTEVVSALHRRTGIPRAVVDGFAKDRPVQRRLLAAGLALEVHEVPHAESHVAVAAASVLARDGFLEGLRRLSDHYAVDLPLGSGAPVAPALRRFLQLHGPEELLSAAKLHFRNVQRALEER